MPHVVPSLGRSVERFIIPLFGLLHHLFKADIAAHLILGFVEKKKRQKSGHTAIAIKERVNA